jgi:hypothetical protein
MIKWTVVGVAGVALLGVLLFGTDCFSYATSSYKALRGKVKSSVPLDFELQRARDLLADLMPELQANVVLVAQEEVAVEELEKELREGRRRLAVARVTLKGLREELSEPVSFVTESARRREAVVDLARRFSNLKLAEKLLDGKEKVLAARKQTLETTVRSLKDAQIRKVELEADIERLENEVRLLRMQRQTPALNVDQSSLVKAERLVSELRKRLALAQKVLVCETLIEMPPEPQETEEELFSRIDSYLGTRTRTATAQASD